MSRFVAACSAIALCAAAPASAENAFTFSAWGQQVNGHGQEDPCEPGFEYCSDETGGGMYGAGHFMLDGGGSVLVDVTYETHGELDDDDLTPSDAEYIGLGVHYISGPEDAPWGVFAAYLDGENHADSDAALPGFGVGVEKGWQDSWMQAAFFKSTNDGGAVDVDGFDDFYFVGGGSSWSVGPGSISAHGFLGGGNWQGNPGGDSTNALWVQVGAEYLAPIGDSGVDYFVGFDVDFVSDREDDSVRDEALMSTVRVGLSLHTGGKKAPFKTPNLRAPYTNFGEIN